MQGIQLNTPCNDSDVFPKGNDCEHKIIENLKQWEFNIGIMVLGTQNAYHWTKHISHANVNG